MQKLILLPYKKSSVGSRMIANSLGVERFAVDEEFRAKERTCAINWGRGDYPLWRGEVESFINRPEAVMNAINKRKTLELLKRNNVPGTIDFTRDIREARRWIEAGEIVLCREHLEGRDGDGIIVARRIDELVPAPLYTKYAKKVNEYRVHVMNGEVFYVNVKRKGRNPPENKAPEPLVRTSSNGWVFVHLDEKEWPSNLVTGAAASAVEALGLDFGGVDIGEDARGMPSVYEVNTAPELGPNTTMAYVEAFKKHYGQFKNKNNKRIKELE